MNQQKLEGDILSDENIEIFDRKEWPIGLTQIPQPPARLFIRGSLPRNCKFLCVVGPRKYTEYAERACKHLIQKLAGYPICIVSGLAYGIDSIAHETALENSLPTIAFPGSGLGKNFIYPAAHIGLAESILQNGGALISEFAPNFGIRNWMFPQRNRLMVGIADAVLIIEASPKSGTMITARLASDYNRTLGIVPGQIFNENSKGSNLFMKKGAEVICSADDILDMLGIEKENLQNRKCLSISENAKNAWLSKTELHIIEELRGPTHIDNLIRKINLPTEEILQAISRLEIRGLIQVINGKICQK